MVKDKKLVSIIVPIYNVENYIEKCVKSLINQTYDNIEIFLVDDGSVDNSGKICDKLSKIDKRIKITHKENGGYGSVLEYAIEFINGEYFLICDPDDWLELNAIETLVKAMDKYHTDFVIGRKKIVFNNGEIKNDKKRFKILKNGFKYNNLCYFLDIPCSPHSKLYKTSLCKNIKFPKKINNTDFLLYQVYLTRASSAIYLDQELSNYFVDRPGNSFNEDVKMTEKSLKSNAIVTEETYKQIRKESEIYTYSILNLFKRSCRYLATMNKAKINNEDCKKIFEKIIDKSVEYKSNLFLYINFTTDSKLKAIIKYNIYSLFYNKHLRNFAIYFLSKLI